MNIYFQYQENREKNKIKKAREVVQIYTKKCVNI